MLKRLLTAVAVTGLGLGSMVAAAPTAAAAGTCTITNFSPRTVTVGLSPVLARFAVQTSGCAQSGWAVEIAPMLMYTFDGHPQETVYVPSTDADAGAYDAIAEADDEDYNTTNRIFYDGFRLLRSTSFASSSNPMNAYPEKLRAGQILTVTGKLGRVSWSAGRYRPAAGATVAVQFKRQGTTVFKTQRYVRTDSKGIVKARFKPKYSGVWRLSYAGTGFSGKATSPGDGITLG